MRLTYTNAAGQRRTIDTARGARTADLLRFAARAEAEGRPDVAQQVRDWHAALVRERNEC